MAEPVSDSAPAQGLTFEQAFANSDAASGSQSDAPSETTTDPVPSPAAATSPPGSPASTEPVGSSVPPGPIPYERHQAILKAERDQREAYKHQLDALSWVAPHVQAGLNAEGLNFLLQAASQWSMDPAAFLKEHFQELLSDPVRGEAVRAWAASVVDARRQNPGGGEQEPQPDLETRDGIAVYSEKQLKAWQQWHDKALRADIMKDVQPLRDDYDARRQEMQNDRIRAEFVAEAKAEFEAMKDLPHFQEHRKAMREFIVASGWRKSLQDAYVHVLTTKVLPTLSQTERERTVADMQRAAHGSSASPRAAAPTTPASPKGFADPSLNWD